MTSVQNPRQQLSGNRYILLALSLVLLSCNAFRAASNDSAKVPEETVIDVPDSKDSLPARIDDKPVENQSEPEEVYETVKFFGEYYQVSSRKSEFKVALILPFYNDAIGSIEKRTSRLMLDYYTGVLMALQSLQSQGISLELHVYDNQNDSIKLKEILSVRVMKSMDFIVGPIKTSQMTIVSEFALKHNIGVISPFSSIGNLFNENVRFYATTPNLRMKAKNLIQFLTLNYSDKMLIILRDGQTYGEKFIPILVDELKQDGKILYVEQEYKAGLDWLSLMNTEDTTIVYLPIQQSGIVNSTLGSIYSTKREAIVIGESSWADFQDNDYGFWTKLNVHLLATDYIDYQSPEVLDFRRLYRQDNRIDPSLYAYLGYDQFHFLGDFLMAFGQHYGKYINNRNFKYLGSSFNFNFEDGLNQNTNLFILRFRDMKLEPVE